MAAFRHWTCADERRLRELYASRASGAQIAAALGRTPSACWRRACQLGLTRAQHSEGERKALEAALMEPYADLDALARQYRRVTTTLEGIRQRLRRAEKAEK